MKKDSKVKITIKGSTSGGRGANTGKSLKFGAMNQGTKVVSSKPATKAKPKPKPQSLVSKAVGRAKSVAREVRDIPTAIGTLATVKNKKDVRSAAKENIKMQIKDVAKAVKGGKGNRSAQTVRKGAAIKSVSSYKK